MGWIAHALVDGALAIGLLIAGIHGSGADYLVLDAAAGYLFLVTVLTKGPGGIWKVLSRLTHRVLDGLVSLGLFASPFIIWRDHLHVDTFATAMAVAVAVILLRDTIMSDHRVALRPAGRQGRTRLASAPIDTRAFEAGVSDVARRAGAITGKVASRSSAARRRRGGGDGQASSRSQ